MRSSTVPPTPSTVAIFGASGRTGRQLVRQALARGHRVKAFARTPARVDGKHDRLEIVEAMRRHGVRRLVITGGAGVGDPHDRPTFVNRVIGALLGLVARHVYEDMRGAVEVVRSSNLDWTVVRLPRLTDDAATGTVRAGYLGEDVGMRIGRADAASFILDQLDTDRYLRAAPVVSS